MSEHHHLDRAGPASARRSSTGEAGTSGRRSADTAAVWAPCCGSSACRWDMCPWARRRPAASPSLPPRANSQPRSPRWWPGRRYPHFRPFLSRHDNSSRLTSVASPSPSIEEIAFCFTHLDWEGELTLHIEAFSLLREFTEIVNRNIKKRKQHELACCCSFVELD